MLERMRVSSGDSSNILKSLVEVVQPTVKKRRRPYPRVRKEQNDFGILVRDRIEEKFKEIAQECALAESYSAGDERFMFIGDVWMFLMHPEINRAQVDKFISKPYMSIKDMETALLEEIKSIKPLNKTVIICSVGLNDIMNLAFSQYLFEHEMAELVMERIQNLKKAAESQPNIRLVFSDIPYINMKRVFGVNDLLSKALFKSWFDNAVLNSFKYIHCINEKMASLGFLSLNKRLAPMQLFESPKTVDDFKMLKASKKSSSEVFYGTLLPLSELQRADEIKRRVCSGYARYLRKTRLNRIVYVSTYKTDNVGLKSTQSFPKFDPTVVVDCKEVKVLGVDVLKQIVNGKSCSSDKNTLLVVNLRITDIIEMGSKLCYCRVPVKVFDPMQVSLSNLYEVFTNYAKELKKNLTLPKNVTLAFTSITPLELLKLQNYRINNHNCSANRKMELPYGLQRYKLVQLSIKNQVPKINRFLRKLNDSYIPAWDLANGLAYCDEALILSNKISYKIANNIEVLALSSYLCYSFVERRRLEGLRSRVEELLPEVHTELTEHKSKKSREDFDGATERSAKRARLDFHSSQSHERGECQQEFDYSYHSSQDTSRQCNSSAHSPELEDALARLWEKHKRDLDYYRHDPSAHPDYNEAKENFIFEASCRGKNHSSKQIEKDWWFYWQGEMERIMESKWEDEEWQCIEYYKSKKSNVTDIKIGVEIAEPTTENTSNNKYEQLGYKEAAMEQTSSSYFAESSFEITTPSHSFDNTLHTTSTYDSTKTQNDSQRPFDVKRAIETLEMLHNLNQKKKIGLTSSVTVLWETFEKFRLSGTDPRMAIDEDISLLLDLVKQNLKRWAYKPEHTPIQKALYEEALSNYCSLLDDLK